MNRVHFFVRNCFDYIDLYNNLKYLYSAQQHLQQYLEKEFNNSQLLEKTQTNNNISWTKNNSRQQQTAQTNLCLQISTQTVDVYLKTVNLQIEITKYLKNCIETKNNKSPQPPTVKGSTLPPTLLSNAITDKINVCSLILLSGESIEEGFGFVIRIIQCHDLKPSLVFCQISRELAKQYNFKSINNLLKCINESGYKKEVNEEVNDACISECIRTFAAAVVSNTNSNLGNNDETSIFHLNKQETHTKDIDDLILQIKSNENRINAYILSGRYKAAYIIAIQLKRADIVQHISNLAETKGQNIIRNMCLQWLEKNTQ
jgi:hypothetical protein